MMNMSISISISMEALAINYLTQTLLHVWAILTAALLTFWKQIHSPSPPIINHHDHLSPSPSPPPLQLISSEPDPDDEQQEQLPSISTAPTTIFCCLENTTRGHKFRVYGDSTGRSQMGEEEEEELLKKRVQFKFRSWHNNYIRDREYDQYGWELAALKIKTSEMGWYRYQDFTVFDGSVVQLWNQSNPNNYSYNYRYIVN